MAHTGINFIYNCLDWWLYWFYSRNVFSTSQDQKMEIQTWNANDITLTNCDSYFIISFTINKTYDILGGSTVYIAICDDQVASRKHIERLLNREATLRQEESLVMYIDAFGLNFHAINSIKKYNAFFINVSCCNKQSFAIQEELRSHGCDAPIYFYHSADEYSQSSMGTIVDTIHDTIKDQRPTIEIRTRTSTHYVLPEDIVVVCRTDHGVSIHLKDTTTLFVTKQLSYYIDALCTYPYFFLTKSNYICNGQYITQKMFKKIVLQNNIIVPLSLMESFQFLYRNNNATIIGVHST